MHYARVPNATLNSEHESGAPEGRNAIGLPVLLRRNVYNISFRDFRRSLMHSDSGGSWKTLPARFSAPPIYTAAISSNHCLLLLSLCHDHNHLSVFVPFKPHMYSPLSSKE